MLKRCSPIEYTLNQVASCFSIILLWLKTYCVTIVVPTLVSCNVILNWVYRKCNASKSTIITPFHSLCPEHYCKQEPFS